MLARALRSPLVDAAVVVAIAAASIALLKPPMLEYVRYLYVAPWDSFLAVVPHTAWAAAKVWTFWAVATTILAGVLLRLEPRLGVLDAVLGGATGVWIFAYVGGNALGPIGLFRTWTIWTLLALAGLWLWRHRPTVVRRPLTLGQKLMVLAFALIAPCLVLLQLGSPVPPFMDVLATPAAAQRIITFGVYQPFDSDPYGYWDVSSQLPGLELFYALLGLGSGTWVALLADTAAITPMAGLLFLATYRLGKTIAGDLTGGMACLLVFATILLRTLPYMHGRTVAFVLVAAGLAFLLDERRNQTRLVLGALAMSTAIATHAIIGALGMIVAAAMPLMWLLSGEVGAALAAIGLLAGTSVVALPAAAVGLGKVVPYPVLPLVQLAGIALIVVSASRLRERTITDRSVWLQWILALVVLWTIYWHKFPLMPNTHHVRFPLLVFGASLGLLLMLWSTRAAVLPWRAPAQVKTRGRVLLAPVVFSIATSIAIEAYSATRYTDFADPRVQTTVHNWLYKIDYWYPFIFAFPTAYFAAWLAERTSRRLVVFAVLAILFVPWRDRFDPTVAPDAITDPNYHQHSISEGWVFQLITGKGGYWGSMGDIRWVQSKTQFELIEVLRGEVAAGRITPATHIVRIEPKEVVLYGDQLLYSVYLGINDDPYIGNAVFDAASAGSRKRPVAEVHKRLAERPPYVAIHGDFDFAPGELDGYTELFNKDGARLYRDDSTRR